MNINTRVFIFLVCTFILAAFLRFYKLGSIPNGLERDETSIGYNAYSLLKTGKDEYGKKYPIYFKAFGEYKLSGYIYSSILPIALFGLTPFAVRFVSALSGTLSVLLFFPLYILLCEKMKIRRSKELSCIATFLLAINPWHLHFSRGAFEVTLALFFLICGLNCFFIGLKKLHLFLIPTCIFFALALYTYNTNRLFIPLLFIFLGLFARKELLRIPTRDKIISTICLIIVFLPFILSLRNAGGFQATASTLIFTSKAVQAPLLELRAYFSILPDIISRVFFNVRVLTVWQYVQNIFHYFSVDFFFVTGSTHGNHGVGNVGQFYLVEFPLLLIGITSLWKQSKKLSLILGFLTIATILIASLTREAPQATRSFVLIIPFVFWISAGLLTLNDSIASMRSRFASRAAYILLLGASVYCVVFYFSSYYVRFPKAYALAWSSEDKNLATYLFAQTQKYDKIIISKDANFSYSSILFYSAYPPQEYQDNVVRLPDDTEGFEQVRAFQKYEYRSIDWQKDLLLPKTLFVLGGNEKVPDGIKNYTIKKVFLYPRRPLIVSIKEVVYSTLVADPAYTVIEATPGK